ncbi:MAG: hypothetical protein K0Q87_4245, partial [Neobacillus sp.]|nr:hypothetical protein [Neobacillus sp.]
AGPASYSRGLRPAASAASGEYAECCGKLASILDRQLQHLGDAFAFVFDIERLAVVPFPFALLARHVDVRQEVHLDLDDTVPATRFAASAFHVKAETSFLEKHLQQTISTQRREYHLFGEFRV